MLGHRLPHAISHHTQKQFLCVTFSCSSSAPLKNPEQNTENARNLHRCDHLASVPYPNECSQPNRNLRQGADWRFRDLGQGRSEASTKIPINDDDLWWFMIYNDLSTQQKSRNREVLRNTCHLDVTIVAWPLLGFGQINAPTAVKPCCAASEATRPVAESMWCS